MSNNRIIIDKRLLIKKYVKNEKSLNKISKELKVSPNVVRKNLINYGIKIRNINEQQNIDRKFNRYPSWKIKVDKDLLMKEYIKNEKSIQQIYREFKIHPTVFRRNLVENGIKIRTDKEQNKIDYKLKRKKNLNPLVENIEKNPEFFYVLGAFEGDGHFALDHNCIQINVIDIDFLEEIKRIFNKYSPETRIKILKHIEAKNNSKAQWRINLCCIDFFNREYHKLLPKTLEEKRYYLRGLIDAEGSVGIIKKMKIKKKNGKVYYGKDKWLTLSQADTTKLDLWAVWLDELGIKTNKCYVDTQRSYLSIRKNESIETFYNKISFKIKRKQKRLNEVLDNICWIKISEEDKLKIVNIYLNTNFSASLIGKMFNRSKPTIVNMLKLRNIWKRKKDLKISANDIDIAECILGRELDFNIRNDKLLKYNIKNLKTSKIKSIMFDKEEEAVDLETKEYHNFFLENGILSHNSTQAMQLAYFVSWMLAGGEMCIDRESQYYGKVLKVPKEKVRFNLDNVCFDVETLMKLGHKMPKNSVIVYDEGREGLDAKSSMMSINRTMEDFLQQCGVYNHFLIIVLPDFFSLNKSFATARSNFLVNVYHNEKYKRGFFSFYAERKKEQLYVFGRKLLGNFARYSVTSPDFYGVFTKWLPFDRALYDATKKKALIKIRLSKRDLNIARQRDIMIAKYKKDTEKTAKEISEETFEEYGLRISEVGVRKAIQLSLVIKEKKILMDEQKAEEEE